MLGLKPVFSLNGRPHRQPRKTHTHTHTLEATHTQNDNSRYVHLCLCILWITAEMCNTSTYLRCVCVCVCEYLCVCVCTCSISANCLKLHSSEFDLAGERLCTETSVMIGPDWGLEMEVSSVMSPWLKQRSVAVGVSPRHLGPLIKLKWTS